MSSVGCRTLLTAFAFTTVMELSRGVEWTRTPPKLVQSCECCSIFLAWNYSSYDVAVAVTFSMLSPKYQLIMSRLIKVTIPQSDYQGRVDFVPAASVRLKDLTPQDAGIYGTMVLFRNDSALGPSNVTLTVGPVQNCLVIKASIVVDNSSSTVLVISVNSTPTYQLGCNALSLYWTKNLYLLDSQWNDTLVVQKQSCTCGISSYCLFAMVGSCVDLLDGACVNIPEYCDCSFDSVVTSIFPNFGPSAGGTLVTIQGHGLSHGLANPVRFLMGSKSFPVIEGNSTYVLAITPPENVSASPPNAPHLSFAYYPININTSGGSVFTGKYFQYLENPQINVVAPAPLKSFLSGGLMITVTGTAMNAVERPLFDVLLMYNDTTDFQQTMTFSTECEVDSAQSLRCPTPRILPPTGLLPNVSLSNADSFYRYPISSSICTFQVGFELDGVFQYRTLAQSLPVYATISMYEDPIVSPFSEANGTRGFNPYSTPSTTTIQGKGLNSACSADDYTVTVGDGYCVVTTVAFDVITCSPPKALLIDNQNSAFAVTVYVGNLKFFVGYLQYSNESFPLYIILLIVFGGGLLLILLIILITVLIMKRRKRRGRTTKSVDKLEVEEVVKCQNEKTTSNRNREVPNRNNESIDGPASSKHKAERNATASNRNKESIDGLASSKHEAERNATASNRNNELNQNGEVQLRRKQLNKRKTENKGMDHMKKWYAGDTLTNEQRVMQANKSHDKDTPQDADNVDLNRSKSIVDSIFLGSNLSLFEYREKRESGAHYVKRESRNSRRTEDPSVMSDSPSTRRYDKYLPDRYSMSGIY